MLRSKPFLVFGAMAALLLCGPLGAGPPPARAESSATKPAENPHWRDDGCKDCHAAKGDELPTGPPEDAERLCLGCHDGKRTKTQAHPVGVPPTRARIVEPAKWPLRDGQLACLTCHDAKLACKRPAFRPATNRAFLRNVSPNQPADLFCRNCHAADQYQKLNPHIMLDAKGELLARRCLICHVQVPDRKALLRTGKPLLRDEKTELCLGCHPRHWDINPKGHLGVVVTDAAREHIRDRDIGVLYAYLKRTAASQPAVSGAEPPDRLSHGEVPVRRDEAGAVADFPRAVDSAGRIVCASCHNPHQQQTFPAESLLGYGAMRVVGPNKVTPSVPKETVCGDCHDTSRLFNRSRTPATKPDRPGPRR